MAGLEPARAVKAQRILSPLRLPFRHIGVRANLTHGPAQTKRFRFTTNFDSGREIFLMVGN